MKFSSVNIVAIFVLIFVFILKQQIRGKIMTIDYLCPIIYRSILKIPAFKP